MLGAAGYHRERESDVSVGVSPLGSGRRWQRADLIHNGLRVLSVLVSVIALGILLSRGQAQMLPIALLGFVLGPAIIMLFFRGPERRFLLTLFFTAYAARLLIAVIAHPLLITQTVNKEGQITATWVGMMFEDDRAYHKVGYGLMEYWLGDEGGVEKSDEYLLRLYTYMVGVLYTYVYYTTPANLLQMSKPEAGAIAIMAPKLMNCFIGAIGIVPFYALGRELAAARVGRLVALAGAFWPSLLLWSVLNLKDVMVVVLIAATMFLAIRFGKRPGLVVAGGLLVSFALMENLRLYIFYAFGWLVPVAFFIINRAPWKRRLATGLALWAAVALIMWGMNAGNQWLGLRYLTDKRLEALHGSASFGADTATTGIELTEKLNRYEGGWAIQMRNVPIVMPYVLWAPFPWKAARVRDLAVVPETLVWYGLQVLSIVALVVYGRARWREFFLPVVFAGGLVFVFSVIEGNVGTIYRHRVMLFPSAFPLAAMGGLWLWSWWQNRRAEPVPAASARAVASGGLT
jgi:hypothetical protein